MFFDSHCHLTSEALSEHFSEVLDRALAARVTHFLNIGDTIDSSARALEQAKTAETRASDGIVMRSTAGIHPQNALLFDDAATPGALRELATSPLVVAIGEIGLDYVYDETHPHYPGATRPRQREVFAAQLQLARELDLPVVIHNREADADILAVLRDFPEVRGVFHCFASDLSIARAVLEAGFHLGFTGLVTFKNAAEVREVARFCPLDRLLIETDSPYLAPVPYRGKTNEPSFVPFVAQALAVEKNLPVEEIARVTTRNAMGLFSS